MTTLATTQHTGVPCELQEISNHGATSGTFALQFGTFKTSQISYSATAENFRLILLKGLSFLTDIKIVKYQVTSNIVKWQIFFINNPGKMLMLMPINVNLLPARSSVDGFMTGSYVDVVSLVVGSAPRLAGTATLTGGNRVTASGAIPIGIAPVDVGPYVGATVQSLATYSSISDPVLSNPDALWVLTFGITQGDVSPILVDTSQLTGLSPVAEVVELVKGLSIAFETQTVVTTCSSGGLAGTSFFAISLGNQQTSMIPTLGVTSASIRSALTGLIGVHNVVVSNPVNLLDFSVTFTDVDLPLPLPLMTLAPPICSVSTIASVVVARTVVGTVMFWLFYRRAVLLYLYLLLFVDLLSLLMRYWLVYIINVEN